MPSQGSQGGRKSGSRSVSFRRLDAALDAKRCSVQAAADLERTADFPACVPRWIRIAMPEDARQEIALLDIEFPALSPASRKAMIRYRLTALRHAIWDRLPRYKPKVPSACRPSKLAKATGYRTDSAAHREARQNVNPETRRAIARKGAQARWSAESSSRAS